MGARLLLAGYFGAGNLGDDAIMLGFLKGIEGLDYHVKVVCGSAELITRSYGVTGVPKTDFGKLNQAIQESDALVFPGGSIFQDVTSVRSVAYYANLVKTAKKAGKKVLLLGQGIGPLNRFLGKRTAAGAFDLADVIAVRDPQSVKTLAELGTKHTPKVTGDCAYLLPKPELNEDSAAYGVAGMRAVGVSARPFGKDKNKAVIGLFSDLARTMNSHGYVPVMMPLDQHEDTDLVAKIAKVTGGKIPELKGVQSPVQLQQRIARMDAVIAMRLHAGILAATVGVPPYMVSYDPKVNAFANLMGLPTPPNVQGLTAQRLFDGFQSFIKDRDRICATLEQRRAQQAEAAAQNIQILRDVLGQ